METSNVLLVGQARPVGHDFGLGYAPSLGAARAHLEKFSPAVLVFGRGAAASDFDELCAFALEKSPETRWIVISENLTPTQLTHWRNFGQLCGLVDSADDPMLEVEVRQALESFDEAKQHCNLVELFSDQSSRLKRLSSDLEARVQRRHKALRKSLQTLDDTKSRMQSYLGALLGIHRATDLRQMEQTLLESLKSTIALQSVRVHLGELSAPPSVATPNVLIIELPHLLDSIRGEVQFAKATGEEFEPTESDFLFELSEALALALARMRKFEQAETLKGQWQATFDSIPHALCIVGRDTEILKLNRAFAELVGADFRELVGKCCLEIFFGQGFRAPVDLQPPFTFRQARVAKQQTQHFEVIGQRLGGVQDETDVRLILLRAITDEVRFERRILDASKLAELGTIGSSIAHELNNPLGGMLSFLQLILMDLPAGDVLFDDIKAMEQAVFRCRDIVLNLLSFARKQDLGDFTLVDLRDVVHKSIKLIELQSKSMGIPITVKVGSAAYVKASANALVQALNHLLQNAIDALEVRLKRDPKYIGQIEVELSGEDSQWQIRVRDNGDGIQPEVQTQIFNPLFTTRNPLEHGGMGLNVAHTIVNEHHGHVEIRSQPGRGTTAVVTLGRIAAPEI